MIKHLAGWGHPGTALDVDLTELDLHDVIVWKDPDGDPDLLYPALLVTIVTAVTVTTWLKQGTPKQRPVCITDDICYEPLFGREEAERRGGSVIQYEMSVDLPYPHEDYIDPIYSHLHDVDDERRRRKPKRLRDRGKELGRMDVASGYSPEDYDEPSLINGRMIEHTPVIVLDVPTGIVVAGAQALEEIVNCNTDDATLLMILDAFPALTAVS
jgi:hypothetical protein